MASRHSRNLSTELRREITALSPAMGATVAVLDASLMGAFATTGVRPRNPKFNLYRGATLTRPADASYVVGFTYDDLKDGRTDEDIYVVDVGADHVVFYPRGTYERANASYLGTHRGPKDYLPPVADPLE